MIEECSEAASPIHSCTHTETEERGFTVIRSDSARFSYRTVVTGPADRLSPTKKQSACSVVSSSLSYYLRRAVVKPDFLALFVGLGNPLSVADSLGFETALRTLSDGVRSFSFAPLTEAKTGIKTESLIRRAAEEVRADVLIVTDALAAKEPHRLGTVIQITDNGITPGSGISAMRGEISSASMPCPVIAIGVPTVIRSELICADEYAPLFVTPSGIGEITSAFADILACAVNSAIFGNRGNN